MLSHYTYKEENLLVPEKMHSGALYNASALGELVKQSLAGNHLTGEFFDRVITVGMATQAAGSRLI